MYVHHRLLKNKYKVLLDAQYKNEIYIFYKVKY